MKLAPEAVKARREHARRTRQRVEVRREESGNASVAGREMDTVDALASKAHIHALALRLRRAGMPGTLDQLRLLVFADLTAGRDPLDRLTRLARLGPGARAHVQPGYVGADPRRPCLSHAESRSRGRIAEDPQDDWAPPGDGRVRDCGGPPNDDHASAVTGTRATSRRPRRLAIRELRPEMPRRPEGTTPGPPPQR